jgi:hypothetical protein
MPRVLYARIASKDQRKVKCGFRDCGEDVATRGAAYRTMWVVFGFSNPPPDLKDVFVLSLLPGFVRDDRGRWHLSNYARWRIRQGMSSNTRVGRRGSHPGTKAMEEYLKAMVEGLKAHMAAGRPGEEFSPGVEPPIPQPKRVELPLVVVCPKCGRPQTLSAEVLGVLPEALVQA